MYCAYITTIKELRKHSNADRLQCATIFGNNVIVDLSYTEGQRVIYFPTDGQLSEEFANDNNLVRKKDDAGNNIGGYLDPDKRNITALKLRGEKSDGLVLPIEVLSKYADVSTLKDGEQITILNGHEICKKYIPRSNHRQSGSTGAGNRTRKKKVPVAPLFSEHADTEQLAYNLSAFKPNDEIEITLKMHGTSQRTGYLPVFKGYNTHGFRLYDYAINAVESGKKVGKLTQKIYERAVQTCAPIYDWGYVSGTRRTVLENFDGGYYGSNEFREAHSKFFEGKLMKGESVYYEVVGFTHTGTPIMSSCNNKKLNDKEFVKQYGEETVFSYGCEPHPVVHEGYNDSTYGYQNERVEYKLPQSDIYVYRMTITNEDGFIVEYTPDFMRYRCQQMGVKTVPTLWKGTIPTSLDIDVFNDGSVIETAYVNAGEWIKNIAEQYYDGTDPIGKTHIREGVVIRIINRPKFTAYKHKNFNFKVLEGIIKDTASAPDMEEAQELSKDE